MLIVTDNHCCTLIVVINLNIALQTAFRLAIGHCRLPGLIRLGHIGSGAKDALRVIGRNRSPLNLRANPGRVVSWHGCAAIHNTSPNVVVLQRTKAFRMDVQTQTKKADQQEGFHRDKI